MSKIFSLVLSGAAASLGALALGAPSHAESARTPLQQKQWCPGQPWELEWGVNWDLGHCHGTTNSNEDDTDIDVDGPVEWGAPPKGSADSNDPLNPADVDGGDGR